jgi:hypothetical protein
LLTQYKCVVHVSRYKLAFLKNTLRSENTCSVIRSYNAKTALQITANYVTSATGTIVKNNVNTNWKRQFSVFSYVADLHIWLLTATYKQRILHHLWTFHCQVSKQKHPTINKIMNYIMDAKFTTTTKTEHILVFVFWTCAVNGKAVVNAEHDFAVRWFGGKQNTVTLTATFACLVFPYTHIHTHAHTRAHARTRTRTHTQTGCRLHKSATSY